MELSQNDRRILDLLQADCRLSNQQLADRLNLSPSACWRRVRALEEAGLVRGYVALLDAERVGLRFSAIAMVSLARHDRSHVENFVEQVRVRPEVVACHATTGDADYHLHVIAADLAAYNAFLDDFLFRLPGVSQVRTSLVLKEIKRTTRLAL